MEQNKTFTDGDTFIGQAAVVADLIDYQYGSVVSLSLIHI